MVFYDPSRAPAPTEWLALNEPERLALVRAYRLEQDEQLESVSARAAIHVAVEVRLAMNLDPAVRASAE